MVRHVSFHTRQLLTCCSSNILYPKEDRESGENRLIFQCRTCTGHEEADNACIYRNEMSNTAGETAGITQDVGQDPTVGTHVSSADTQSSQSLASPPLSPMPDFCTMCGQEIFCETCGSPTDFGCFLEVDDPDVEMSDSSPIEDAPEEQWSAGNASRQHVSGQAT